MARNGRANFDDLNDFREELQNNLSEEQIALFMESCSKELAARLLSKVIKRTPVGDYTVEVEVVAKRDSKHHKKGDVYTKRINPTKKKGGTLRRGWTNGTNVKEKDYANSLRVNHNGNAYVIEIVNNVEYASYVEHGHRQTPGRYVPVLGVCLKKDWVEGKHMLRDSKKEVEMEAPKILKRKLRQKLEESFR